MRRCAADYIAALAQLRGDHTDTIAAFGNFAVLEAELMDSWARELQQSARAFILSTGVH